MHDGFTQASPGDETLRSIQASHQRNPFLECPSLASASTQDCMLEGTCISNSLLLSVMLAITASRVAPRGECRDGVS